MNFLIEKEDFLNNLKIVEKATIGKGIQPILANILIEAENNVIKFTATDLDISIVSSCIAQVKEDGKITLPARTLFEIASKLPDKPVEFKINSENNSVKISCENAVFDVVGIGASEFPKVFNVEDLKNEEEILIESKPFLNAIRKTAFAAANFESKNVISGVFCSVSKNILEMAATDGNRLTQSKEEINNKKEKEISIIIPAKTLSEIQRICSIEISENINIFLNKTQIVFNVNNVYLYSRLLEGQYPPYQQLIPKSCSKIVYVNKEALTCALDRVSVMVNEKMNIVKLKLEENKLYLTADTPSAGASEDVLEIDYSDEEMAIAFNYKYMIDCLKVMDGENITIGLNGSLSASLFKQEKNDNYLCLIMPIQIK